MSPDGIMTDVAVMRVGRGLDLTVVFRSGESGEAVRLHAESGVGKPLDFR